MSFLLFLICLARIPGSGPAFLPAPVNLSVNSINFFMMLQWDPGPGTPAGTQYNVSKKANNKKFHPLTLTNETFLVLKLNHSKDYWFMVRALFNGSQSNETKAEFNPFTDNVVGPLNLSLSGCGSCLRVNISVPEADRHSGIPDVQKFYDSSFKVFWRKGPQGKVEELSTKNKTLTLFHLEEGVEYCVQAHMSGVNPKKTIPSAWICAFTSPAESRTGAAGVNPVVASLVVLFILSVMVLSGLHYTGFLCQLKAARPRALMTPPAKVPVFTPDETFLHPVCITPAAMTKPTQVLEASLTSSEDEEEEGEAPLYMDRVPELSSREGSGLECCGGSGEGQEAAENPFRSLKALAEEEEDTEEEGGIAENSAQTGVQGEEKRIPEISSNVNLVSVMLASFAAADEDEEEEHQDFLKHLSQGGSGTPSEDEVCERLLQPADEEEEEEEEEEVFSEYLRHA